MASAVDLSDNGRELHLDKFGGFIPGALDGKFCTKCDGAFGYPEGALGYPEAAFGYPEGAFGYPEGAFGYPEGALG